MKAQSRNLVVTILLANCLAVGYVANANSNTIPASLVPLLQDKETIALRFAQAAAACVKRNDTKHAAFHGCIDWHSAVHGVWTLVAYTAMTGDRRFQPTIERILSTRNLEQERKTLADNPEFENPYGRAWLLRLSLEYEKHYKSRRMRAIADEAAQSLLARYKRTAPNSAASEYENAAWALINLADYFDYTQARSNADFVRSLIRVSYIDTKASCDSFNDRQGFMSICLMWAWAASKTMPREDFVSWSLWFIPPDSLPLPISDPKTPHEYGLNFNRTWGLWELFSLTVRPEYIDSYVAHFCTTYKDAANWQGDYGTVGHWVPQFGMFAIQPLFGSGFR